MKKRLKMILTASMLAFCLALMGFGVYAASSHTLNVENYISFDIEDNIAFSIEGYRTSPTGNIGSRTQSVDSYYNQTSKQGGSAYEVGMADNDGTLIGWNISTPIVKLYAGETMTWTFTIINKGGNPIYINMINATNPWGENATLTSNSNVLAPTDSTPTTFTITFKVADTPTFNADTESEALSFNIKLSKEPLDEPKYAVLNRDWGDQIGEIYVLSLSLMKDDELNTLDLTDYNEPMSVGSSSIDGTTPFEEGGEYVDVSAYYNPTTQDLILSSEGTIYAPTDSSFLFAALDTSYNEKLTNFYEMEFINFNNFNTSNVINMESMFDSLEGLTELDVSNFNTNKVTNMYCMFYGCASLTQLDLSNFDTSSVVNNEVQDVSGIEEMFSECSNLTQLDLSSFDLRKTTYEVYDIFSGVPLKFLKTPKYVGGKIDLSYLTLYDDNGVLQTEIPVNTETPNSYNLGPDGLYYNFIFKEQNGEEISKGIYILGDILFTPTRTGYKLLGWTLNQDGSGEIYTRVENFGATGSTVTLYAKWEINSYFINFEEFGGSEVENDYYEKNEILPMPTKSGYTFMGWTLTQENGVATGIEYSSVKGFGENLNVTLYAKWEENSNVAFLRTRLRDLLGWYDSVSTIKFVYDNEITNINSLENLGSVASSSVDGDTEYTQESGYADITCYRDSVNGILYISSSAKIFAPTHCNYYMPAGMQPYFSNFDTRFVTDMSYMFSSPKSYKTLDLSCFDTSRVTNMSNMFAFDGMGGTCYLEEINLSSFDTSNVTNMSQMFWTPALKSIDVSNFNTSKVEDMGGMFTQCYEIIEIDLSNFDLSSLGDRYGDKFGLFSYCYKLEKIVTPYNNSAYIIDLSNAAGSGSKWYVVEYDIVINEIPLDADAVTLTKVS